MLNRMKLTPSRPKPHVHDAPGSIAVYQEALNGAEEAAFQSCEGECQGESAPAGPQSGGQGYEEEREAVGVEAPCITMTRVPAPRSHQP